MKPATPTNGQVTVNIEDIELHPIIIEMNLAQSEIFGSELKHYSARLGNEFFPKPVITQKRENQKHRMLTEFEIYFAAKALGMKTIECIITDLEEDEEMRKINFGQMFRRLSPKAKFILIKNIFDYCKTLEKGKEWFKEVEALLKLTKSSVDTPVVIGAMVNYGEVMVKNYLRLGDTGEKIHKNAHHYFQQKGLDGEVIHLTEMLDREKEDRESHELVDKVLANVHLWEIGNEIETGLNEIWIDANYLIKFYDQQDCDELKKQVDELIKEFMKTHPYEMIEQ